MSKRQINSLHMNPEDFARIITEGRKVPVGGLGYLRGIKVVRRKYEWESDPEYGNVRSRSTKIKVIFEPSTEVTEALI
jgi:hypothetical protein